jgi:hypothetical protein
MHARTARPVIAIAIFAVALGGGLLVLQSRGDDTGSGGSAPVAATDAAASEIWAVGDEWTVKVRQDAGSITPGGEKSIAEIPYRFEVVTAPEGADGAWVVKVFQDGAEGPFAEGWTLQYVARDGKLQLHRVALGTDVPLEAELASIVLGPQFPYEVSYSAPPKDATIDAERLLDRAALPPTSVPGSDAPPSGDVAPPAEAPALSPGGAPSGAAPAPAPAP